MRTRPVLGLCLVVLLATVPFLGKAFHIDDPLYLAVARQILAKPWDPFGAEVLWEKDYESLFDADFNPPLWNYLMAGVLAVTGEPTVHVRPGDGDEQGGSGFRAEAGRVPEVGLHLLESAFVAAAIVAMVWLGRRWVRWPLAATALVALGPAMLPGQNAMLEGPVLAFWLWGVCCHLRAVETNAWRWTWASGALAALGVLTKYTSGLVLVILAAYSLRRRHGRSLWFLAPPLVALALWSLHNWHFYHRAHVLVIFGRAQTGERHPVGVDLYESWGRLWAIMRLVGAVTAMALPMVLVVSRRFGKWVLLLLAVVSFAVGWVGMRDMTQRLKDRGQILDGAPENRRRGEWLGRFSDRPGATGYELMPKRAAAHAVAFGALGAFALGGLAASSWWARRSPTREHGDVGRDEELLLWVWLLAVIGFGIFAVPFLAVRHLLPGIPPLVWLALRRLADADEHSTGTVAKWMLGLITVLTVTCGFLVAKADYDFAAWNRHVAVDVGSRSVAAGRAQEKPAEVWFTGHWGWAYYAERAGMKPFVPGQSRMRQGDLVLMPLIQTWDPPPKEVVRYLHSTMPPIKPTPRLLVATGNPRLDRWQDLLLNSVRSISTEVHFYSGGTLNLPWQFSRKPLDDFAIIAVTGD